MSNRSQRGAGYAVEGQVDISTVNDRDTGIEFPSDDRIQLYAGGVAVQDLQSVSGSAPVYGPMVAKISAIGDTGVFSSTANPFGYDVLIKDVALRITTGSTDPSTIDVGTDASASTSDDTAFDALSAATAGIFHSENATDGGLGGTTKPFVWISTDYFNVAQSSGDATDLVCDFYVTCVRL